MSTLPILPLASVASEVLAMGESARKNAVLCRVMAVTGFGGRRDGEAVLISVGEEHFRCVIVAGSLLGGSADDRLFIAASLAAEEGRATMISAPIGDEKAVRSGLACGGTAEILVEPLQLIPLEFWTAVASRSRIGLVSPLVDSGQASTGASGMGRECLVGGEGSSIDLPEDAAKAVADQLRKGTVRTQIIEDQGLRWFCEIVSPMPHVAVIGVSGLATAITNQARLLGWTTTVVDERTESGLADSLAAARALGTTDALVVLSHDLEASCGALDAAANESLGNPYLGALGSRHTQAARAERLGVIHGWSSDALAAIHGPVGLDIGSRTPEETALAIAAEVIAHQRNRTAASLRVGKGPISAS
jgi:xanthine dehydrogenase accessory factor